MSKKMAYNIVFVTYFFAMMTPIVIYGYLFNCMSFVIISTICVNYLRKYTYGYHTSNLKCTYLTYCLIIIFSYLSKTIPIEWSYFIGIFCMRDIYIKSPLELCNKGKDYKWHLNKMTNTLGILIGILAIGLFIENKEIVRGIIWSIVMIDLTLFKNKENGEI